jgi:hypothetical protein
MGSILYLPFCKSYLSEKRLLLIVVVYGTILVCFLIVIKVSQLLRERILVTN